MRWITRLGWLLLVLALAAALLYVAASAWLEGAGGRKALEGELTRRAGIPVRLLGDFQIMLVPSFGVAGTELVVGGPGADEALVHSGEYAVALEPRALLAGELRVGTIRLAHGALRLDRIPPSEPGRPGLEDSVSELPAIGELLVSDFVVTAPGESRYEISVIEFAVEGFEERRDTQFRVEAAGLGGVAGTLRWDSADPTLRLDGAWSGLLPDALGFQAEIRFAGADGNVAMRWPAGPAEPDRKLRASAGFVVGDEVLRLNDIELSAGAQSVVGFGCLLLGAAPGLQLDLITDSLDLDRLPELPAFGRAPDAGGAAITGLDIDLRLSAGELRKAGAVARNAVLSVGDDPDCGQPDRSGPGGAG